MSRSFRWLSRASLPGSVRVGWPKPSEAPLAGGNDAGARRCRSREDGRAPPRLAHSHVIWRLGDVHFLSAAEKRRLALERPYVWSAYRARLFPLP